MGVSEWINNNVINPIRNIVAPNTNPTPSTTPIANNQPAASRTNQVDLYYNIDDRTQQVQRQTGNYKAPLTPVTNPVHNPQNVPTNTNIGNTNYGGHSHNSQAPAKVGVYYNIDKPTEQFTKPTGNYAAKPAPVENPTYSITQTAPAQYVTLEAGGIGLQTTKTTTTYTNAIDPYSVTNNINQKTDNTKYSLNDIRQGKISTSTYLEYKGINAINSLDKISKPALNIAFTNIQTGKVESKTLGYQLLNKEVPFSPTAALKLAVFAPYMSTGVQTYKNIFGNSAVQSKNTAAYISPIERLKIPEAMGKLAATPSQTVGKEAYKINEDLFINQATTRQTDGARALTLSTTRLTPTGADRIAGFTKGTTIVNVKTLSGNTFGYSNSFTFTSRVTDITQGAFNLQRGGIMTTFENVYGGKLSGIYYQDGKVPISTSDITTVSKVGNGFTDVVDFRGINKPYANLALQGTGRIYDMSTTSPSFNIIDTGISSNSKQLPALATKTGLASGLGQVQKYGIISTQGATYTPAQAFDYAYKTGLLSGVSTASSVQTKNLYAPYSLTTTAIQSMLVSTNVLKPIVTQVPILDTPQALGSTTRTSQSTTTVTIPSIDTTTDTRTITRPIYTPGINFTPDINYPPEIRLRGLDDSELSSRTLKGGKKNTRYTPSFTALVFNLGGKYKAGKLSKTGLDFRPTSKAFKIKVRGLQ